MLFRLRIPCSPLSNLIENIWLYQGAPVPFALQRILPTGTAQLIVNLKEDQIRSYDPESGCVQSQTSGAVLAGVRTRCTVIDTNEQEHVLGVSFKPGGLMPFFRVPAHETCNADIPLAVLWARSEAASLRERLLNARCPEAQLALTEQVLSARLSSSPPDAAAPHPAVAFALSAFSRRPLAARVKEVTDAVGLSPKRFIERFKAEVGIGPKQYCRILRFQQAVTQAHQAQGIDWPRLALDCGYSDQAHFIHEFRSFAGLTPGSYRADRTEFQNHVKFLQYEGASF